MRRAAVLLALAGAPAIAQPRATVDASAPGALAVTATMPSATPSKRTVDSPGGNVTCRVSLIIAKP